MPTCIPNCMIPTQSNECCSSPRCYVGGGPISLSNLCFDFSWEIIFRWWTTLFWFVAGCKDYVQYEKADAADAAGGRFLELFWLFFSFARHPQELMAQESSLRPHFRLRRYRIIWTKKWKRCGLQWCVSYSHGAIVFYNITKRESEFKSSRQAEVPQVAVLTSSRNIFGYRTWPQKLNLPTWKTNGFAAGLQHNQITSGPSFKAPIGDRNQTCKARSAHVTFCQTVRMSSEFWWRRRSTRRSHVFFTLARSSLKSRDFSWVWWFFGSHFSRNDTLKMTWKKPPGDQEIHLSHGPQVA